jgi:hypothetical protein
MLHIALFQWQDKWLGKRNKDGLEVQATCNNRLSYEMQ